MRIQKNEQKRRNSMKTASALVMVGVCGYILVSPTVSFAQNVAGPARPELRAITVDASSNLGEFKSLRGVNSGPLPWTDKLGVDRLGGDVEVSDRTGFRSLV
jgi:hypothetical protein